MAEDVPADISADISAEFSADFFADFFADSSADSSTDSSTDTADSSTDTANFLASYFEEIYEDPPIPCLDDIITHEKVLKNYYANQATFDRIRLEGDDDSIIEAAERLSQLPPKHTKKKKPEVPPRIQFQTYQNEASLQEEMREAAAFPKDPLRYIDPIYRPAAYVDENGVRRYDIDKVEYIYMTRNDPPIPDAAEKERLMKKALEILQKWEEEHLAKRTVLLKRSQPDNIDEEVEKEKFIEFKYEKKNKLWNRKAPLREMYKNIFLPESRKIKFTKGGLESFCKDLTDYIEMDLNYAVHILRLIGYSKLCKKHFLPEFTSGAFAEADENISISAEHFEFLHENIPMDFLEIVQSENLSTVVYDLEKDPQINNIMPSILEFLKNDSEFKFLEKGLILISAVIKNPYRKCDFFFDMDLPAVKAQIAIVEYLMNCLRTTEVFDKKFWDQCTETVIRFAKIHPAYLALIVAGFDEIISTEKDKKDYDIYCRILNIILTYASLEDTMINLSLPKHFEKLFKVAVDNTSRVLYFNLLKACETSFKNKFEIFSLVKEESDCVPDLALFHATSYQHFGATLTVCFRPLFRKCEEQYLVKKKIAFAIADCRMARKKQSLWFDGICEMEPKKFPQIFESISNSSDKILSNSSITQLGYRIQEDTSGKSFEDTEYLEYVEQLPLSYMKNTEEFVFICSKNKQC